MGELIMINKIKNTKPNKGQISILVLLASAILLTLGLSASRKTIIDTKVDTDEEFLKEAFNTAESGLNNYLNIGSTVYSDGSGGNATVSKADIGGANSLVSEGKVPVGSNQLFWLVNHNVDGTVGSSYYGQASANLDVDSGYNGALKIDYYYIDNAGVYKVSRLGCNYGGSTTVTGYLTPDNCSALNLPGRALLLIVTPIGVPTSLTLSGLSTFPFQGEELTSVGTINNGVKTQIKTRNIYQIPSFFIESITAQNNIQ
jgi:hypothetical protein